MGTVPITINGVIYPKNRSGSDQPIPATFVGEAWISDLGVGGGPVMPPTSGGSPGLPIHPIWGPPGISLPPGPGYPPVASHPLPPIPPMPIEPPPDGGMKPPPPDGGWGYHPDYGWGYFPGGGGKPQPLSA